MNVSENFMTSDAVENGSGVDGPFLTCMREL